MRELSTVFLYFCVKIYRDLCANGGLCAQPWSVRTRAGVCLRRVQAESALGVNENTLGASWIYTGCKMPAGTLAARRGTRLRPSSGVLAIPVVFI